MTDVGALEIGTLTPKQQKATVEYVKNGGNKQAAYRAASLSPSSKFLDSQVAAVTIAELLGTTLINRRCTRVLLEGLRVNDENDPIASQRERRMTVETIGKFTGQLGPDIAIGVGVHASIDQTEKAVELINRFSSYRGQNADAEKCRAEEDRESC